MKKYLILFFVLLGLSFAPCVLAEEITGFDVIVQINQDATINVSETIKYDFGDLEKHGIFRTIPVKYKARGGNYNLRISDISVVDEYNKPYNFAVSSQGSYKEIKIGDADIYVTGVKTYVINYKIKRAINYFDQYDELYWNVTGNEWPVSISDISASINFPSTPDQVKVKCFIGAQGDETECKKAQLFATQAIFTQDQLAEYEGLTVVLSLPKGTLPEPSLQEKILMTAMDNWSLFIPIIVFIVCFYFWYTRGRDPKGRGVIIAEYNPPGKLSPSEMGTVFDAKTQPRDVSSEIVNLAIQGYLKINRLESGKIFKKADYEFTKLKGIDSGLDEAQRTLLSGLFEYGADGKVKLSDLREKFYKTFKEIDDQLWSQAIAKGYFTKNYRYAGVLFTTFGIITIIASFFIAAMLDSLYLFFGLVLSGIIMIIFGFFMPKRTKKGVLAKEHILGLKEYLTVAEKDRIKFHNAPEKNPQEFERLLPYAMVLGVEKEWAKQFEDIYKNARPNWYNDPSSTSFNSFNLANSLSGFKTASAAGLVSQPAPSSSSHGSAGGFSGFSSGGGFSGGGFGGGGGGSW